MDNKMKKQKTISIFMMIIIIAVLVLLSITIKAKDYAKTMDGLLEIMNTDEVKAIYDRELAQLAFFAKQGNYEFVEDDNVSKLFKLNNGVFEDASGGKGRGISNENSSRWEPGTDRYAIYYPTAQCAYHTQSDALQPDKDFINTINQNQLSTYNAIVNIIDIDQTEGKVTVYRYKDEKGTGNGESIKDVYIKRDGTSMEETTSTSGEGITKVQKVNTGEGGVVYYKKQIKLQNNTVAKKRFSIIVELIDKSIKDREYSNYSGPNQNDKTAEEDLISVFFSYKKSTIWDTDNNQAENMRLSQFLQQNTGLLSNIFTTLNKMNGNKIDQNVLKEVQNGLSGSVNEYVKLEKIDTKPTVQYKDGKSYIGPLKIKWGSGSTSIYVNDTKCNWVTENLDDTFNDEQTGNITSERRFYAVYKGQLNGNITVKAKHNYTSKKARIVFTNENGGGNQNHMYYSAKPNNSQEEVNWTVEQGKTIKIQKQDADGENLSVAGIKFYVYDENNQYVGELTTTETGETNILGIQPNKNYIIREVQNNKYGYKGCIITDASITKGKGEVSVNNGVVTLNVSENSTISIKNEPELGKLTIHKVGDNNENLEGVQFYITQNDKYLRLFTPNSPVITDDSGIDLTKVLHSYTDTMDNATIFKTNASGKIVINNLEVYSGLDSDKNKVKYNYWVKEISNDNYGYKNFEITSENIEVTGGEKLEVDADKRNWAKVTISENTVITVKNKLQLGSLTINKVGDSDQKLENVQFLLWQGLDQEGGYFRLTDNSGFVPTITQSINIRDYSVEYVSDKALATKFITNSSGDIVINNLEIYAGIYDKVLDDMKYDYKILELANNNYGYGSIVLTSDNASITGGTIQNVQANANLVDFNISSEATLKVTNKQQLGSIQVKKVDTTNNNIVLPDVEFVIENYTQTKGYSYLALYDINGNIVSRIRDVATINKNNVANENEFKVEYKYFEKQYKDLNESEKAQITSFATGDDGILQIANLEKYLHLDGTQITYKLIETNNPNYGYVADSLKLDNITIEAGQVINKELGNEQKYTGLSGYVWVEKTGGKSNIYDKVYTENDVDVKLTDLYIMENGSLVKNPNAQIPVTIQLWQNSTVIRPQPDEFDNTTGKYTFKDVLAANLNEYKVVFVYDGFYYTTVAENSENINGSKVKEIMNDRENLNSKFATVQANNEIISSNNETNSVEYKKDGKVSTVNKFGFDTTISASTAESKYNLKDEYDKIKKDASGVVTGLDNINMGIVLREQPDISIITDINSATVKLNEYEYIYDYNTRMNYLDNNSGVDVGVNFENLDGSISRYTRTIYASDIAAAKENKATLGTSIIYQIRVINESSTLTVIPKQITNYFDSRYTIEAIGTSINAQKQIEDLLQYNENAEQIEVQGEGQTQNFKSTVITLNKEIKANNSINIYIRFKVSEDAVKGLLDGESTYHNATELRSYSTLYGEQTNKQDGKLYTTDSTEVGKIYGGIDQDSAPGNIELELKKYTYFNGKQDENGTMLLNRKDFEDDTNSAPSLVLEKGESRIITGTVWEDLATQESLSRKERLGNGVKDETENVMANVKVTLYEVNTDGSHKLDEEGKQIIAKYSDGTEAKTVTDAYGNYAFGYLNEQEGKYVGVLPGTYIIRYAYNDETYIADKSGNKIKGINALDYKSTIITSESIRAAIKNGTITHDGKTYAANKWYLVQDSTRYSDAIDDLSIRNTLDKDEVKNSTYKDLEKAIMEANTPMLDIGIEATAENESIVTILDENGNLKNQTFVTTIANIDFGIIKRPEANIVVEKSITGLELIAQNGTALIPKSDPTTGETIQYVRSLKGDNLHLVSAEIDANLTQGAKLNLEYTVSLKDDSQIDYLEPEYYLYGTGGITKREVKANKVVDYLDASISLDETKKQENEQNWKTSTADELKNSGLIDDNVYNELQNGEYTVLLAEKVEELTPQNGIQSMKLYTTKYLAVSSNINIENKVEIVELKGGRTLTESIPGNHIPPKTPPEPDTSEAIFVITPPTGATVNYVTYIIAISATLLILVAGIVIIKKKIIK